MHAALMGAKSQSVVPSRAKAWQVVAWCLPAILGFPAFLLSFPIDRKVPFLPHLNIAEVFLFWFLIVTPISTGVAMVMLRRHARLGNIGGNPERLLLAVITIAVLANLALLLGMYATRF